MTSMVRLSESSSFMVSEFSRAHLSMQIETPKKEEDISNLQP